MNFFIKLKLLFQIRKVLVVIKFLIFQENKSGVKIAVIGNLRDKLISDDFIHSFESCLNLNGCDVIIQDATYKFYWYVYFHLIRGIKSDRLEY